MSRIMSLSVAVLLALLILGCDKPPAGPTPLPPPPPPLPQSSPVLISIRIDGPQRVAPGETAQYTATGAMSDGTSPDLTATVRWRTSDSGVMTISQTGLATTVKPGQVTVQADQNSRFTSVPVSVLPPGTFRLTGTVREAGFGVSSATVSLLNGSIPVLSTKTSQDGSYQLFGVAGDIDVRASKDGYVERVNRLLVTADARSDFELSQTVHTDVSGGYRLTVTADSGCIGLPEEAKRRSYDAEIAQDGPGLRVALSGGSLITGSFTGRFEPDSVTFNVQGADTYYYYYLVGPLGVIDQLTSTTAVTFAGRVLAKASPAGISGTLTGDFGTVQTPVASPPRSVVNCFGNHQFVLVRR